MYNIYFFFFFQAENGIQDLVRSRGLGDVNKGQGIGRVASAKKGGGGRGRDHSETGANQRNGRRRGRLVVCSVFGEDVFRSLDGEYKFSLWGVGPGS